MKILHILSSISSDSGVMNVVKNYSNQMTKDICFDYLYFKGSDESTKAFITNSGGMYHKISRPNLSKKFKEELKTFLIKEQPDCIHIHQVFLAFLIYPIAKKVGIKKVILHSHTTKYSENILSAIRNKIMYLPIKFCATDYIGCSKAASKLLYHQPFMTKKNVVVINNAIDNQKFKFDEKLRQEVRGELSIEDNLVIGHVGRFQEQKNHKLIIDTFNELLKINNQAKLLLIGSGPLLENMKQKVKTLGIESNVLFLGNRNDVNRLYNAMDIFFLPSLYEGLPISGVEAITNGLPFVTSTKVTRELDLYNSYYINLKMTPSYFAQMITKVNTNLDRKLGQIKAKEAGFDIVSEAKKLESIYIK